MVFLAVDVEMLPVVQVVSAHVTLRVKAELRKEGVSLGQGVVVSCPSVQTRSFLLFQEFLGRQFPAKFCGRMFRNNPGRPEKRASRVHGYRDILGSEAALSQWHEDQ